MLSVYRAGTGFDGSDEYAPLGAENSMVATGLPAACFSTSGSTTLAEETADTNYPIWKPGLGTCLQTFAASPTPGHPAAEHLRVDADVPYDGYLILHLRSYPAWQVKVNGQPATSLPERADGLIAVRVPKGRDRVTVDWTATEDTWIGRWLSALGLALLIGLWWMERRLSLARLSSEGCRVTSNL